MLEQYSLWVGPPQVWVYQAKQNQNSQVFEARILS